MNIIYLIILIVASIGLCGVSLYVLTQGIKCIVQLIINDIDNIDECSIGIIALTLYVIVVAIVFIGIIIETL